MFLLNFKKKYKLFLRYRQIGHILIKHGLGFIFEQFGFIKLLNFFSFQKRTYNLGTLSQRIRMAFEELGPTFIKFGQLLSLRSDILPEQLITELSKLLDKVEPFPFEEAIKIIENEYQKKHQEIFLNIEKNLLGSASIAQVYKAKLLDNKDVIIKIKRPNIEEIIELDIEILFKLAHLLLKRFPQLKLYEPTKLVDEFAKHIRRELDFQIEAQNCERFYNNFLNDKTIYIPKIYHEYTTSNIIVMEYIKGVRADQIEKLKELNLNLKQIAKNGASAFYKMILIDGLFHGDPHPANVLIKENGQISFIDFGITGKLTSEQQKRIVNIFLGIMTKDTEKILKTLLSMGLISTNVDLDVLRYEIEELIDIILSNPLKKIEFGNLLIQVIKIAKKHNIKILSEYSLLGKAIIEIEAIGRTLDPDFEANSIAENFIHQITKKILLPDNMSNILINLADDIKEFITESPKTLNSIIKKIERGKLAIEFHHIGLEELINKLDVISNRISISLIISATIVASGFIVMTGKEPTIYGIPALGLIGFIATGIFGLILIISLLKSGRF